MYKVVLFDPLTSNIIVCNRQGATSSFKINEKGYVIDSYSHGSTLLISGVFFDEFILLDWAITGNKMPQKLLTVFLSIFGNGFVGSK